MKRCKPSKHSCAGRQSKQWPGFGCPTLCCADHQMREVSAKTAQGAASVDEVVRVLSDAATAQQPKVRGAVCGSIGLRLVLRWLGTRCPSSDASGVDQKPGQTGCGCRGRGTTCVRRCLHCLAHAGHVHCWQERCTGLLGEAAAARRSVEGHDAESDERGMRARCLRARQAPLLLA